MRLITRIVIRVFAVLAVLLSAWAVFFYISIIDEVNDETDDALENYSEVITTRVLGGRELPTPGDGTNNTYSIVEVTPQYAQSVPDMEFYDAEIYFPEMMETEPARVLKTIFLTGEGKYMELTVSTPSIEKDDLQEAILYWMVFLFAALLVCIVLVVAWVFYRNMRPLYTLLHWLDDYRIGGRNRPLDNDTNVTEFRRLNEAAVRNAGRAEQLFEQQKQFIGNASHEMQTPLAVCQGRLEWLTDHTELTEEQMGEVFKTRRTLEHLSRLNKSLLFLSKIDNGQFPDSHPIDLNTLVADQLADLEQIYAHKHIAVSVEDRGALVWDMNEALATALVSNLLKNAFVHSHPDGEVRVELSPTGLSVYNSSDGHPLDEEKVFDRFYQGTKKEGSTGLGLAVVRAIGHLYGLKTSYRFVWEKHCFSVVCE